MTETSNFIPIDQDPSLLVVNEIYRSIQGESTFAGLPCVFVRLAFCDLRCEYCDTSYAFYRGERMSLPEIAQRVESFGIPLVEVTGGEPLAQPATPLLLRTLCDSGYRVLLETGGHRDIGLADPRVVRIMDIKCPGSGMCGRNRLENIPLLTPHDEVKFVMCSREDYEWARDRLSEFALPSRVRAVLFSAAFGKLPLSQLAEWILEDRLPVRFQLQLHKYIWEPSQRGV